MSLLEDKTKEEQAIEEQAIEEQAIEEQAIEEQAIGEQATEEQATEEQATEETVKSKKSILKVIMNSFLVRTLSSIVLLAILATIGSAYAIIEDRSDPSKVAEQFYNYYLTNNWSGMYGLLDNVDDEYLNQEMFELSMLKKRIAGTIDDYKLSEPEKTDKGIEFEVKYIERSTGEEKSYKINLLKQKRHGIQLVTKWKVDISDEYVNDIQIEIPKNMELYFEELKLEDFEEVGKGNSAKCLYTIPVTFNSKYNLSVKSGRSADITEEIELTDNLNLTYTSASLYAVNEKVVQEVENFHKEMLTTMYDAASDKKSYKKILKIFPADKEIRKSVKKIYNNMKLQLYPEDIEAEEYKINTLSFNKFDTKYNKLRLPKKGLVRIDCVYDFTAGRDISIIDGYEGSYKGKYNIATVYTISINDDGTWEITGLRMNMKKTK